VYCRRNSVVLVDGHEGALEREQVQRASEGVSVRGLELWAVQHSRVLWPIVVCACVPVCVLVRVHRGLGLGLDGCDGSPLPLRHA
jgi:hypothetical protein